MAPALPLRDRTRTEPLWPLVPFSEPVTQDQDPQSAFYYTSVLFLPRLPEFWLYPLALLASQNPPLSYLSKLASLYLPTTFSYLGFFPGAPSPDSL